jgi:hypothetical protein
MPVHPSAESWARLTACLSALCFAGLAAQQQAGGARPADPAQPVFEGTAAVSGIVTDATTNQPIPGVMVYLGFQGRGAVGRLSRQISDEKGRFVFTDLPAGNNFFINASKPGYVDGHYGVGAGGQLGGLITLTDGQWFSDARIGGCLCACAGANPDRRTLTPCFGSNSKDRRSRCLSPRGPDPWPVRRTGPECESDVFSIADSG